MMLAWITAAFVLLAIFLPPIPQPQSYHAFVDARTLLGVPNFWNVTSNLPFLIVGVWGVAALLPAGKAAAHFRDAAERWPYLAFFAAITLTGFGSAWYHLAPDDARLVWDRLPIALACAALPLAMIVDHHGERHRNAVLGALLPALAVGAFTVGLWSYGFRHGDGGNLAPYFALQVYAVAVTCYFLLAQPARYTHRGDLWVVIAIWGLARAAEWLDAWLYAGGNLLSGHTLKHLLAALASGWVLRMIRRREPLSTSSATATLRTS